MVLRLQLFGIILATPFVMKAAGGWNNVIETAKVNDPQSLTLSGGQTFYGFLAGYFPLFFMTSGDQNMYQRVIAGKNDKTMRIGFLGWFLGVLIVMPLVAVIAFCAKHIFGTNIEAGMAFMSTTTVIPTVIGGLLLAALCWKKVTRSGGIDKDNNGSIGKVNSSSSRA